jgi:radical SAM enzyme (TIGR01210 family)
MTGIPKLMNKIRTRGYRYRKAYDSKNYVSSWIEDDKFELDGTTMKAFVVILRTIGCHWSRTQSATTDGGGGSSGGCTMCGYINDCLELNYSINPKDIVYQFKSAVEKFNDKEFQYLKVFSSGSFLDDSEISIEVRSEILQFCTDSGVPHLLFETRPEFVTSAALEQLICNYKGRIQIAIGLESANDYILKNSINKGFSFDDYRKAIKIIRDFEFSIKTYLLLKPPFLREREAIFDVLNSIKVLGEQNLTDCISINPVNIQKFTIIEYLFGRRDYRPPWLWSVVEVLRRGSEMLSDSKIRLLSQPTAGGTIRGAHNCGQCDKKVLDSISKFSLNNDPSIFDGLTCSCRSQWEDALELENLIKSQL